VFYGSKMLKITKPPMEFNINCNAADFVAMVVSDLKTEADDAVELVLASFDPLRAVTYTYAAMADGVL
jgi:CO/xanthine dehydrogenase Mo-binding subunit